METTAQVPVDTTAQWLAETLREKRIVLQALPLDCHAVTTLDQQTFPVEVLDVYGKDDPVERLAALVHAKADAMQAHTIMCGGLSKITVADDAGERIIPEGDLEGYEPEDAPLYTVHRTRVAFIPDQEKWS